MPPSARSPSTVVAFGAKTTGIGGAPLQIHAAAAGRDQRPASVGAGRRLSSSSGPRSRSMSVMSACRGRCPRHYRRSRLNLSGVAPGTRIATCSAAHRTLGEAPAHGCCPAMSGCGAARSPPSRLALEYLVGLIHPVGPPMTLGVHEYCAGICPRWHRRGGVEPVRCRLVAVPCGIAVRTRRPPSPPSRTRACRASPCSAREHVRPHSRSGRPPHRGTPLAARACGSGADIFSSPNEAPRRPGRLDRRRCRRRHQADALGIGAPVDLVGVSSTCHPVHPACHGPSSPSVTPVTNARAGAARLPL